MDQKLIVVGSEFRKHLDRFQKLESQLSQGLGGAVDEALSTEEKLKQNIE